MKLLNTSPFKTLTNLKPGRGNTFKCMGGGLSKQLIIGNIYRPPKDLNENYKQFTHELSQVLSHFEELNADTIIAGDTNINLLKIGPTRKGSFQ